MSITGANLLVGFSRFIGDSWSSTTTSAGNAGGTTLVDTALRRRGDDGWRDFFVRITSGTNDLEIRKITDFTETTGTITVAPAFTGQVATSVTYELHRYDPAELFKCLDDARIRAYPDVGILRFDDSITADGVSTAFDIPSTIRRGPLFVLEENPLSTSPPWNFLTDPIGDSTSNWAASSVTASTIDRDNNDLIVPKYDTTCTKLVVAASTAATYSQVVGSMANSITAALAADREMAFCAWAYCTEGSKIRLGITDDSGTTYGSYHGGAGWELLAVEDTIVGNNTTLLTVVIDITSTANAATLYWNRGWFYFGTADRVRNIYSYNKSKRIRRDDTTQKFYLDFPPPRGYQLRLIGRDTLSALGTTPASQETNTMEVDEEAAQVLYAEAARVLFEREGINSSDLPDVAARMQFADRIKAELRRTWRMHMPAGRALVGPWAR